jgi:energy-coupling factor transporter ATP-binding protein EcfA2
MLQSVLIHRFRSCVSVTLENIESILVLIGRNGAGKSNILQGLEWACHGATHGTDKSNRVGYSPVKDGHIQVIFLLEGKSYRYSVERVPKVPTPPRDSAPPTLVSTFDESLDVLGETWQPLIRRNGEVVSLIGSEDVPTRILAISNEIPSLLALQSILPESDLFRVLAEKIASFLSGVRYYPLQPYGEGREAPTIFVPGTAFRKWVSDRVAPNPTVALLCKVIHLSLEKKDRFEELRSLIGKDGLGLLADISVTTHKMGVDSDSDVFYLVFFRPTAGSSEPSAQFAFENLSFGTKRIFSLILAMMYDEASVSLLEQPEDGVHAGLVDKLLPLLRAYSSKSQIVIASHSTDVLNNASPKEVRLVSMSEGITAARSLSPKECEAAKYYLEADGPLSEFIQSIEAD